MLRKSSSAKHSAAKRANHKRKNKSPRNTTSYENVLDYVVKVFAISCEPNYCIPWAATLQQSSISSAFIVEGQRILTNAHSVRHHTSLKVKKRDFDKKFTAKVVSAGEECDLALLTVDDDGFWNLFDSSEPNQLPYLTPGPLPKLQDPVLVIGYPGFSDQISVTAGVTSHVEMRNYSNNDEDTKLLCVQIDAAINGGNSGGPVVNSDNQVVGIAFSSMKSIEAEAIGYIIPYCVVQHFLDDIGTNSRYTSFPFIGFGWQVMENKALRRAKDIPDGVGGVLVTAVSDIIDASHYLKAGDVITNIEDVPVSNVETVPFRAGERIEMDYLVTSKFTGDLLKVGVLRNGKQLNLSYDLSGIDDHNLVKTHDPRLKTVRQPEYVMFGGLVFQVLSVPYLEDSFGSNWKRTASTWLTNEYNTGRVTRYKKETVVLSEILASECTEGYNYAIFDHIAIVTKVNGTKIRGLSHLAELIDTSETENVCFELFNDATIIINKEDATKEEDKIRETHSIKQSRLFDSGEGSASA